MHESTFYKHPCHTINILHYLTLMKYLCSQPSMAYVIDQHRVTLHCTPCWSDSALTNFHIMNMYHEYISKWFTDHLWQSELSLSTHILCHNGLFSQKCVLNKKCIFQSVLFPLTCQISASSICMVKEFSWRNLQQTFSELHCFVSFKWIRHHFYSIFNCSKRPKSFTKTLWWEPYAQLECSVIWLVLAYWSVVLLSKQQLHEIR